LRVHVVSRARAGRLQTVVTVRNANKTCGMSRKYRGVVIIVD
jgi:hypothetical protein